ncbi:MAG: hypothetical protein ABJC09_04315 [Terriglobia bacterium]
MDETAVLSWREVIEKHQTALAEEIAVRLDSQLQRAVLHAIERERAVAEENVTRARADARETTLRATAESLNQALRRLRQAANRPEALRFLAEGTGPWSTQVVVLAIEHDRATVTAARGLSLPVPELPAAFPIETAPALAAVFESRDPVTSLVSNTEISPLLASAFGGPAERKVYLFPVLERGMATAILAACGETAPAPLELLCEAAGMRLDGLAAEAAPTVTPLPNPVLVNIGGQVTPPAGPERRKWDELSPDDQQLHLKAQRMARVRIAEIRLQHADGLRKGAADGNLYGALCVQIDAARTEFLQAFLSKSPTMVDYLHLEILRSLAHDNDRILGEKYPGPMV